jgi:hypothetical protein
MLDIAPLRPLDEAAALEWLRSRPGGRTSLPAAELGRRWGWHRQRANRRVKAWQKAGLVTRRGNVITAADSVPKACIDLAACIGAIVLAGAAAFFSIKGMVVLFPGASLAVVVMASAMEGAKLVTVGWLAQRWRLTALAWRVTLAVLVAGLAVINATGVYAQLVAAHVGERGPATLALKMQDAALAARVGVAAHTVADLDRRLGRIDLTIEEAAKRDRTTTALTAIATARKTREVLAAPANVRVRPLRTSTPSAPPWAPRAGRSRLRLRPSATSPSFLASTLTVSDSVANSDDRVVLRSAGYRTVGCGLGMAHNQRLNAAKLECAFCRPRHLQQNPCPVRNRHLASAYHSRIFD